MGIKTSLVEIRHDEGYGDHLLDHINQALGGKDMHADAIVPSVSSKLRWIRMRLGFGSCIRKGGIYESRDQCAIECMEENKTDEREDKWHPHPVIYDSDEDVFRDLETVLQVINGEALHEAKEALRNALKQLESV